MQTNNGKGTLCDRCGLPADAGGARAEFRRLGWRFSIDLCAAHSADLGQWLARAGSGVRRDLGHFDKGDDHVRTGDEGSPTRGD